ncbi:hypothetical protein [Sutcliffiella rhizosphaerae]|uniref:Uncharacterized protein n=1 Tax=Sutcliffiella rhizosphaerae TaxID=2880967 RepID=A0ABM8YSH2_9BACI|nr:hypothetical protein [Sutcliffiella rhizosphaerae]CAG9622947.1 hypothetical protein BACCIP111883_03742 [Sutcliffiella rhizosphaerae]
MVNSEVAEGDGIESTIPDYYLEYTFVISNNGNSIGSMNENLNVEFIPSEVLLQLLGKDIFSHNPNNGAMGPASLSQNTEGEFILVFGLENDGQHVLNKENMEELLQGQLRLYEGQKVIILFPVTK